MSFLLEYHITEEVIQKIKDNHEDSMLFSVLCFKENVKDIIEYLQSIHIEVIDELLINRLELFLVPKDKLQERIERYNVEVLVSLINEDINILNNV